MIEGIVKRTYEDLFNFLRAGSEYLAKHPDEKDKDAPKPVVRLKGALRRVLRQAKAAHTDYQEHVEDLNLTYAATDPPDDPKGIVRRDAQGRIQFTPEKEKERNQKRRELFRSEYGVRPVIVPAPEGLSEDELEAFAGLVIPEEAWAGEETPPAE